MPDYRRAWLPGGTYFFTVNLLERQGNDLLTRNIELLRAVVKSVRQRHPFKNSWLGGLARTPALRHRIAFRRFGLRKALASDQNGILQGVAAHRRIIGGTHPARRAGDMAAAILGTCHSGRARLPGAHGINPLKHGLVKQVAGWPYSTFHRLVADGVYPANWGGGGEDELGYDD